ncbi:hypothetical protein HQ571_04485 [Candidatus Kuenenbacteria bacterium]|nr:hypothetical protein [Candidatus Kuenenbacteria bacterium]
MNEKLTLEKINKGKREGIKTVPLTEDDLAKGAETKAQIDKETSVALEAAVTELQAMDEEKIVISPEQLAERNEEIVMRQLVRERPDPMQMRKSETVKKAGKESLVFDLEKTHFEYQNAGADQHEIRSKDYVIDIIRDEAGRVVGADHKRSEQSMTSGLWKLVGKTKYDKPFRKSVIAYDESGKVVSSEALEVVDGQEVVISRSEFGDDGEEKMVKFDGQGSPAVEKLYRPDGTVDKITKFTYREDGTLLRTLEEEYDDSAREDGSIVDSLAKHQLKSGSIWYYSGDGKSRVKGFSERSIGDLEKLDADYM